MDDTENQLEWLDGTSPADDWDAHVTKRVLDELFCFARQYRTSESFDGLLKFVAGFRLALQTGSSSRQGKRRSSLCSTLAKSSKPRLNWIACSNASHSMRNESVLRLAIRTTGRHNSSVVLLVPAALTPLALQNAL